MEAFMFRVLRAGAAVSNPDVPILNHCAQIARRGLPAHCLLCAAPADDGALCAPCRAELPYLADPLCPRCALPSPTGETCGACLRRPPHYDAVIAPCVYAYPLDRLIQAFKFHARLAVAPLIAGLMLDRLRGAPAPDLVVPLPLARERLVERGFNQSVELARPIAHALGLRLAPETVERVRHAAAQSDLPWSERARNVRGAFVCVRDVRDLSVAIVDDVMTTGATLEEVARVLKRRGATRVSCWVAARTLPAA